MARRRKSTASKSIVRTVHVPARAPSPIIRVSAPSAPAHRRTRHRRVARRVGRATGRLLGASVPQVTAIVGAGVLGLLQKQGVQLPKLISSLSTPANVGILSFLGGKFFKSPTLDHVATGTLSVALWAHLGGAPIQGDEDVMGTGVVYGDDNVYGDDASANYYAY